MNPHRRQRRSAALRLLSIQPHGDYYLEEQSADSIQHHIMKAAGARGYKALVKFVEAAACERSQQSQGSPEQTPAPGRGESGAPGEKRKRAEQAIAAKMSGLTNQEMNLLEPLFGDRPKQRLQNFRQDAASVFGRKHVTREHGQHA